MKHLFYNSILLYIFILIILCLQYKHPTHIHQNIFLTLGIVGQCNLLFATYIVYKLKTRSESVKVYIVCLFIYLLSFIMLDIYFLLNNPHSWGGHLHYKDGMSGLIVDFLYYNLANLSTIGVSDITALTIKTRLYVSYKFIITIIIVAFLINDIVIKSRN